MYLEIFFLQKNYRESYILIKDYLSMGSKQRKLSDLNFWWHQILQVSISMVELNASIAVVEFSLLRTVLQWDGQEPLSKDSVKEALSTCTSHNFYSSKPSLLTNFSFL